LILGIHTSTLAVRRPLRLGQSRWWA